MSRTAVESDIRKTLGLVPEFLTEIPDTILETEWASFKEFERAETVIPRTWIASHHIERHPRCCNERGQLLARRPSVKTLGGS
jgi:hypothetical protein